MKYTLIDEAEAPKPVKPKRFELIEEVDPTGTFSENLAAGAGKAVMDMGRGSGQFLRSMMPEKFANRLGLPTQADIDEAKRLDAPLMRTGGGIAGNIAGTLAVLGPTAMIPGANTYAGAAVLGGLTGAAQPVASGESRALNTTIGTAGGIAGKAGGDWIANKIGAKLADKLNAGAGIAATNAERDSTLSAARGAGFVVPPSQATDDMIPRALEGFSNKISVQQTASKRNQDIANAMARKALGLADDTPLNEATMRAVRDAAGEAYDRVGALKSINWDHDFERQVSALARSKMGGVTSNPADEAIDALMTELRGLKAVKGDALIADIKNLREMAKANYGAAQRAGGDVGKSALAEAQQKAATMLEDLAERNLMHNKAPASLIQDFRAARKLMAKSYSVENAMREGSGNVDLRKLAAQLNKGVPLEGELLTSAKFANTFPKAAQSPDQIGSVPLFTLTDLVMGGLGTSVNPALATMALARPAARSIALSDLVQNSIARPSYGPSALLRGADAIAWNPAVRGMIPAGVAGATVPLANLVKQ